jgi:phospholipid/cholesterol/gamma-HCH transport system substrate-binding protein
VEAIVGDVRAGRGTVGKLISDDQLYRQATAMASDVQQTVASLRSTTDNVREMVEDLRVQAPGTGIADDIRRTVGQAEQAVGNLAETTEALKHNFLVRGFFTRRGFFDMGAIPEQQYREGQLELGGRTALRLWIAREHLFEEIDGALRLTADGQARLDSAMSEVLKYPPSTPLMVEGYAPGATRETRYRRSREQASQVLGYIQSRYRRDTSVTASIPLGPDTVGEPPGDVDTWDGVALTMYVMFDTRASR